jgi:hypothetical protein
VKNQKEYCIPNGTQNLALRLLGHHLTLQSHRQVRVGTRLSLLVRMVNLDTSVDALSEIYAQPPFGAGLNLPVVVIVDGQVSIQYSSNTVR